MTIATPYGMPFRASDAVSAALAGVNRTEDLQFSPDGKRLAIAGFAANRILVLEVASDSGKGLSLEASTSLQSPEFRHPHGLCWIDDTTMAVANRDGNLVVITLPPAFPGGNGAFAAEVLQSIGGDNRDQLQAPGSVAVSPLGDDLFDVFVCDNAAHYVTRHLVDRRQGFRVIASEILVAAGLDIPDGLALGPAGAWLAVSNHNGRSVHLYRNVSAVADRERQPDGLLRGINYPHGLRFSPDGRTIIVADAAAPLVHVFSSEDGDWSGTRMPSSSIEVLDDASFVRGHVNPEEGGPKGLDISPDGCILAITCHEVPLAFFDISGLAGRAPKQPPSAPSHGAIRDELVRRLASARQELAVLRGELDASRDEAATRGEPAASKQLQAMLTSTSWRVTAPLRAIGRLVRRAR